MEEGLGWIKERKRRMTIEGGFPLLEVLRLWISSLESSKTFSFAFYSILGPM